MITIKTGKHLEDMRMACKLTYETIMEVSKHIKPGVTTKELDKVARTFIKSKKAKPAFLHYGGFPASICTSVNEEIVHGIPSNRLLQEGDIISIDCGVTYNGFNGDACRTFPVGKISEDVQKLLDVTKTSFFKGIENIKNGSYVGDISHGVQIYAESHGYGVVKELVGHGIGRDVHEDPDIPNYGRAGSGPKLRTGMTIAVEPMLNMGTEEVVFLDDGWTCITKDRLPSAHYENTILITDDGVEILTN